MSKLACLKSGTPGKNNWNDTPADRVGRGSTRPVDPIISIQRRARVGSQYAHVMRRSTHAQYYNIL